MAAPCCPLLLRGCCCSTHTVATKNLLIDALCLLEGAFDALEVLALLDQLRAVGTLQLFDIVVQHLLAACGVQGCVKPMDRRLQGAQVLLVVRPLPLRRSRLPILKALDKVDDCAAPYFEILQLYTL